MEQHSRLGISDSFGPTVETSCSQKKTPFQILVLIDSTPGHPRALVVTDNEISVGFVAATTASILWGHSLRSYFDFKSFREIFFPKTEATIAMILLMKLDKVNRKPGENLQSRHHWSS